MLMGKMLVVVLEPGKVLAPNPSTGTKSSLANMLWQIMRSKSLY